MKPQREGGGPSSELLLSLMQIISQIIDDFSTFNSCNNIYRDDLNLALERMEVGDEENEAYFLLQRIFPAISPAILMREGDSFKDNVISELGVYAAYLRNKNKVVMNEHSGFLMQTKVSSSNEGGVAAGFAVLDSVYLV